jgi:hypothetical protein
MKRCQERGSRNPKTSSPLRENLRLARQLLGGALPIRVAKSLEKLSNEFNFSLSNGELQFINSCWYVTHTGLIGAFMLKPSIRYVIRRRIGSFSRRRSSLPRAPPALSATETLIRPMFLLASAAPKCAWPRREPSTAPFARPTASASAQLRKSGPSPNYRNPPESRRSRRNLPTGTTVAQRFVTAFAN